MYLKLTSTQKRTRINLFSQPVAVLISMPGNLFDQPLRPPTASLFAHSVNLPPTTAAHFLSCIGSHPAIAGVALPTEGEGSRTQKVAAVCMPNNIPGDRDIHGIPTVQQIICWGLGAKEGNT